MSWRTLTEGQKPQGTIILGNCDLGLVEPGRWLTDQGTWSTPWEPTHYQNLPSPPVQAREPTYFLKRPNGERWTSNKDLAARSWQS